MKKENAYQPEVIALIQSLYPGAVVLKNDTRLIQGFPDLTILYRSTWAVLETKRAESSTHQPNQDYYVNLLSGMSFSSFIYPENEREVLDGLQRTFGTRRPSRFP